MSKADCLSYLTTHPGKHTTLDISIGTNCDIDSTRVYLRRLDRDGAIQKHVQARANVYHQYEAL